MTAARARVRPRLAIAIALVLAVVVLAALAIVRLTLPTEVTLRSCRFPGPLTPAALDPCRLLVMDAVTARITHVDPRTGRVELDLAESLTTSDNRNFTIRLAADRHFSDNSPVTAHEVARAWQDLADCRQRQPAAFLLATIEGFQTTESCRRDDPRPMTGLTVLDDRTLVIRTSAPDPDLPARLAHPATAPMPESYYEFRPQSGVVPIGAGPFEIAHNHGNEILLRRSPSYTGPFPAAVDSIRLPVYIDGGEAFNAIFSQELDFTEVIPADRLIWGRVRSGNDGRFALDASSTTLKALRVADSRLADPRQRRALSMALDRDFLATRLFDETVRSASGWSSDGSVGSCETACTYSPEDARTLWEQAGGITGQLTLWGTRADGDYPVLATVCNEWKVIIGLNCEVELVDSRKELDERVNGGSGGVTLVSLQESTAAQPAHLTTYLPLLDWHETDAATAEAVQTADHASLGAHLAETMAVIPLWAGPTPHLSSSRLRDVHLTPMGTVDPVELSVR